MLSFDFLIFSYIFIFLILLSYPIYLCTLESFLLLYRECLLVIPCLCHMLMEPEPLDVLQDLDTLLIIPSLELAGKHKE